MSSSHRAASASPHKTSSASKNVDLLRTTMIFKIKAQRSAKNHLKETANLDFDLIESVKAGKLTQINDGIQKLQRTMSREELANYINNKNEEGKTALFYACYFNYQNILLYLLSKGADPFIKDQQGRNCFFILAFKGLTDCINIIQNYLRHTIRKNCLAKLKSAKKTYSFIKSDISRGVLVSPNASLKSVKANFLEFMAVAESLFTDNYLEKLYRIQDNTISQLDEVNRTCVHYSAMSKYTRCNIATKQLMINEHNKNEGYQQFEELWDELQFLELNVEKREETRSALQILELFEQILSEDLYQSLVRDFRKRVRNMQRRVANTQDHDGYTPTHIASFNGDYVGVQFLMDMGADEHLRASKDNKQVIDYAQNNQVRKTLLDLKEAARRGDVHSFDHLLNCETKNKIDERTTILTIAPIHNAVQHVCQTKNQDILNLIIKCGANLDINDGSGWTPLHHACQNGDLETVKTLLKNEANVNAVSNKSFYPIHIAALNNHPKVIEVIFDHGAKVSCKDHEGCTPLLLAAKKGHCESIKMLLDLGADIYATDIRNWSALHYASYNGHDKAVNLLCKYDADYEKLRDMRNSAGKTARDIASLDSVKFQFNTVWKAAYDGNLDILRRLHQFGENINETTREKLLTPLMIATQRHHILVVKYLLDNGANKKLASTEDKTALNYASDAMSLIKTNKDKKKVLNEAKATKNEYSLTKDKKREYFPDLVSRIEKTFKLFG